MNNLQIVREAVIKAVPEIMELKFGCLINWGGKIKYNSIFLRKNFGNNYFVHHPEVNENYIVRPNQVNKVLGRPIRLADVLVAIKECELVVKDNEVITWMFRGENMEDHGQVVIWNILKDDLSLQSPETINFLSELLK